MQPTATEILTQAGLQKTVWGKRILAAEKRGKFTPEESALAKNWQTCACGEQDPRIPRQTEESPGSIRWDMCPVDDRLSKLGSQFDQNVRHGQYAPEGIPQAAKTLVRIESRSAGILLQEQKKALKALREQAKTWGFVVSMPPVREPVADPGFP